MLAGSARSVNLADRLTNKYERDLRKFLVLSFFQRRRKDEAAVLIGLDPDSGFGSSFAALN
jgi:hypothetical protein